MKQPKHHHTHHAVQAVWPLSSLAHTATGSPDYLVVLNAAIPVAKTAMRRDKAHMPSTPRPVLADGVSL